jgi:uncharacterized protein (UPF0276 family)
VDAFSLNSSRSARAIPARAGVGLKAKHYEAILRSTPDVGFFEVHAENYMGAGGPPHRYLEAVRSRYPLSIHGVGLSIGSSGPLDRGHLLRLKTLISRYEPGLVSEHLAWSTHAGEFLNDLLPIPYTEETLALVCERVDEVQTILGRRILIENPATYIAFSQTTIPEKEFLAAIAQRTGCGLLLDINNICVSAMNHGYDAKAYLDAFPAERVGEIHLAGAAMNADGVDDQFLIDAHDRSIGDDVWALYVDTLHRAGPIPTLVEWDNDVPSWPVLFAEARRAEALLRRVERDKVRIEASNAVHAL